VLLDLRHLGEAKIDERLPLVRELSISYMGVDPVHEPIPVRPVAHYTMGGIDTNIDAATPLKGLFAAGECACVSINGANRLGSNSLVEILVFGAKAANSAVEFVNSEQSSVDEKQITADAEAAIEKVMQLFRRKGTESITALRNEMNTVMENGAGIYRSEESLLDTVDTMKSLKARFENVELVDKSNVYNTDLTQALELGCMLDVALAMATSALNRRESRGSHQRLDHVDRNDVDFLRHTLASYAGNEAPTIDYRDVVITKSPPAKRVYGGESK